MWREKVVKRATVQVDEDQAALLRRLALADGRSFADLVHEALGEYLARREGGDTPAASDPPRRIPEEEWQARFAAALQRIRAGAPGDPGDEEIEAEITAARAEVRRGRAAGRQVRRA
jgi:hypothetical protein